MKKLLPILTTALIIAFALPACGDDNNGYNIEDYAEWDKINQAWLQEMKGRKNPDGTPYYTTLVPNWSPGAYVLIHYFNDRAETEGNLSPLYNSTVDVIYKGYNCKDEPFDSSTTVTQYGYPGVQRFQCNGTIQGWSIAMMDMRVGDTAEIVVPYQVGYGVSGMGNIAPFSNLRFNVRLHDIYRYEASPY